MINDIVIIIINNNIVIINIKKWVSFFYWATLNQKENSNV